MGLRWRRKVDHAEGLRIDKERITARFRVSWVILRGSPTITAVQLSRVGDRTRVDSLIGS